MIPGSANALLLATAAPTGYNISRSLRFNSADSAYLSRTPASAATSSRKLTYSTWVKRATLTSGVDHFGLSAAVSGSSRDAIRFSADALQVYFNEAVSGIVTTDAVFRDVSAWYHVVISIDTTNATTADRVVFYVNGVRQSVTGTQPSQNYDFTGFLVSGKEQNIGRSPQPNYYTNSYLADIFCIDGQALDPTSFGEFSATTGVWVPKAYTGSYGTNGFYLDFTDNSTAAALGYDAAGSNDWTVNNLSVTAGAGNDSLVDVPTNGTETDTGLGGEVRGNYCTLNPLNTGTTSLSNGNLEVTTPSTGYGLTYSTIAISSDKWYWEVSPTSIAGNSEIGIAKAGGTLTSAVGSLASGYSYVNTALKGNNNSYVSYGATYTTNDIIGVALDLDAGTLVFYKNGSSQGTAYSSLSGEFFPALSDSSNSGGSTFVANFGQRPFAYTAPSGFKALCTANLPAGTITTSGSFTGNANADGPFVWLNGVPTAMTINGNAVTFGTHADKLANGFKVRTSSGSYNTSGSNTYSITTTGDKFKDARAQTNP